MSNETIVTIVGNLTDDPSLKFLQTGSAVVNMTVASTPRSYNKQTNEGEDGDTLFMRCSLWREAAENVAESLTKGMRVVVVGRLVQRSWETNGEKRTVMELQFDEIGPSLRYATARVTRTQRADASGGGGWGGGAQAQGQAPAGGAANDPWASPPQDDSAPF